MIVSRCYAGHFWRTSEAVAIVERGGGCREGELRINCDFSGKTLMFRPTTIERKYY